MNDCKIHITKRDCEILQLLYEGFTSKLIGEKLYVSRRTVEDYRHQLMKKTSTHNVAGLIKFGLQNGLIKT